MLLVLQKEVATRDIPTALTLITPKPKATPSANPASPTTSKPPNKVPAPSPSTGKRPFFFDSDGSKFESKKNGDKGK